MTVEELQVLITANSESLKKEINNVNSRLSTFEKQATSKLTSIKNAFKSMIPIASIVAGIVALGNFVKSSEEAYKTQIQNETRLIAVMKQLSNARKQDVADILALTDAQQKMGVVGDEIQLAGAQELATYVDKAKSIKKLIPQMNNMIAQQYGYNATQEEAINIATMMGKVLEGQTGALSRYGYYFDENQEKILKFGTEEEKVAVLTDIIHDSIGDVNQALGDTPIGRQIQLANAWSDVKEQIGYVATQIKQVLIPVFQVLVSWIGTAVSYLRQFLQALGFTAKKQSTATKSMGAGTTAQKKYGDAVDRANKKQKEQLATFDEMTVLRENNTGSTSTGTPSTGGAGIGGGINDIDFDIGIDGDVEVTEKIQALADFIRTAFEDVKTVISDIWSSEPMQAYVEAFTTYIQFIWDYWTTIGGSLINNISTTWNNIKDNMSVALGNMSKLWTTFWTDVSNGIKTWGQPIIDGVNDVFNSIWEDVIDPTIQIVSQAWADFSQILVDLWNEYGRPLIDKIGEFATKTIALFKSIWDNVLEPIIKPFLETLKWLWDKYIKDMIKTVGEFVMKLINGALDIYNKFIAPVLMWLLDKLKPAFQLIGTVVSNVFGNILAVISGVIKGVTKVLSGIIDFIVGVFTLDWKRAWEGVKEIFQGIVDTFVAIFKAPINFIIDGINLFIKGLNKIKIPDWVPGIGGLGFHIEPLQKLAKGGVVDRPTTAVIGEAGREAVLPLENNTGWITELAEQISNVNGGGQPQQIIVKIGEDTIFNKVIDGIKEKSFENNGEVFNV